MTITWDAQNCYKLGRLLSVDLANEIETGYATFTPTGGGDYYDGSAAELAGLAAEGAEIEQDMEYEDHLADVAATLSAASSREQQREAEDREDKARRSGPHHNRPSPEDRLARALDRISRGSFVPDPAITGEPIQDDLTARISAIATCGRADEFGYCMSTAHEPGCTHLGTLEADEAGQLRPRLPAHIRDGVRDRLGASYNAGAAAPLQTGSRNPRTPADVRRAFEAVAQGSLFGASADSARTQGRENLALQATGRQAQLQGTRKPRPSRGHRQVRDELGTVVGLTSTR